jgi:hypothetical protein
VEYRARIDGVPSEELLGRLLDEARAAGAEEIVVETSHESGEGWIRAGFTETSRVLVAPVEALASHLGAERRPSYGSIHVQTDDVEAVVTAVRRYVPRLPGRSRGSVVLPPRDGWSAVHDELCDREPEMLRRLAVELSNRSGSLVLTMGVEEGRVVRYIALDRGRVVDEYLSVPEYYGALPPGEVIALGANARLMARLTGADPNRVRAVAVTAATPELLGELARLFGLQGAVYGYEDARAVPGAIGIDR